MVNYLCKGANKHFQLFGNLNYHCLLWPKGLFPFIFSVIINMQCGHSTIAHIACRLWTLVVHSLAQVGPVQNSKPSIRCLTPALIVHVSAPYRNMQKASMRTRCTLVLLMIFLSLCTLLCWIIAVYAMPIRLRIFFLVHSIFYMSLKSQGIETGI